MSNEADVMPKGRILGFGIYLIVLNLALLYVLVRIWPGKIPPPDQEGVTMLRGSWLQFEPGLETRYLLIVAVAGALGSYIHLATSSADYVGNRQLVWSWGWWYILRPFIGMALAVIFYFVIRAGLITVSTSNTGVGSLNPYGVAAIAAMAGMFSKQATDKLGEVFENLFKTDKPADRADKLKGPGRPDKVKGPHRGHAPRPGGRRDHRDGSVSGAGRAFPRDQVRLPRVLTGGNRARPLALCDDLIFSPRHISSSLFTCLPWCTTLS